ncbi:Y-family DNA polymerase [Autumnicola musiva]|uniref:Y-family DNA polymerase n=1 Tax=Autumnicola musiva TaxID=3075589 RepID=A0ABU3D4Z5_9FLAO|nr:Y-family DNA polymerase [Zunongwangia sp. F117]MDT0676601.1 Y-family DNA polymerase [Zunongwangia sp. F117]
MFALVDCNNFYASCERVFNPMIKDKAVVVLSNNDGCVIARSNEAKALDIPMGAPAFLYEKIFKNRNVQVFSSNYALYGDMSSRVMNILSGFTPEIEIYSIDESFLKFEGFRFFDLRQLGLNMVEKVKRGTGIPISVGIAPTKSLAKIANKIAKKFSNRTGGVYILDSAEKIDKALACTRIEDVWGIGWQHAKKLQGIKVYNALQFTKLPHEYVRKEMTQVGLRLKRDLSGENILDLEEPVIKKNIAVTRAFEKMYSEYHELRERVSTYCARGAYKLRKQQSCCSMIYVFLHTNPHRQDLKQYRCNIAVKLASPANSTIEITKAALSGLAKIFRQGYEYKKAGIILMGLIPESQRQLSLFSTVNSKHEQLMKTIDHLNRNLSDKVKFAGQDLGRTWKARQEKLSPRYTTRLEEILLVHAK